MFEEEKKRKQHRNIFPEVYWHSDHEVYIKSCLQINRHRSQPGDVQSCSIEFWSPSTHLLGAASPSPQSQDTGAKNHPGGRSHQPNLNLEICIPTPFSSPHTFPCILESTNSWFPDLEWTTTLHNWAGWYWKDSTLLTWLE